MKMLIFEGVATSGKSAMIDRLVSALPQLKIKIIDETKTHMPINTKTDDPQIEFFKDLIATSIKDRADILIFDRLYLTQAFRTKAVLSDYAEIEAMLLPYSPVTIFLKVDEDTIANRVTKAIEHRDPAWGDYVNKKGKTMDEIAAYYIEQQHNLRELLKQSKIPYKIFDTTKHDYPAIVEEIEQILINTE